MNTTHVSHGVALKAVSQFEIYSDGTCQCFKGAAAIARREWFQTILRAKTAGCVAQSVGIPGLLTVLVRK
jgi:hypothetical protein